MKELFMHGHKKPRNEGEGDDKYFISNYFAIIYYFPEAMKKKTAGTGKKKEISSRSTRANIFATQEEKVITCYNKSQQQMLILD